MNSSLYNSHQSKMCNCMIDHVLLDELSIDNTSMIHVLHTHLTVWSTIVDWKSHCYMHWTIKRQRIMPLKPQFIILSTTFINWPELFIMIIQFNTCHILTFLYF